MKSRRSPPFQDLFAKLPERVQAQAREAYRLFAQDPRHPSLRFKRVSERQPLYSVRIGKGYRAVGLLEGDTVYWFWIGTHAEYDHFLSQFR